MIRVERVSKEFNGVKVLDDISFTVERGSIYGFLGHNGAGKTTTLRIINGFLKPDLGRVSFENDKMRLGYMPEVPVFYQYLSLREYLEFVEAQCKVKKAQSRISEMITKAGLSGFEKKRISHFSKGMRQRAALASALLDDPDIVLLDEPLSALDPEGRKDVMEIISELKDEGKTILISTHILSDVETICDRVGVLKEGKILIDKSLSELKRDFVYPIVDVSVRNWAEPISLDQFKYVERIQQKDNNYSFYTSSMNFGSLEIMKYFAMQEIEITNLNQRESSLEDIYLKITREGECS